MNIQTVTHPKAGEHVRVIGSPEIHTVLSIVTGLIAGPHVRLTNCGNPNCDCRGLTSITLLAAPDTAT